MGFNIAIDGPAGAGKSTIAKNAARELSFVYVDTGAMYRAIGLGLAEKNVNIDDEKALEEGLKEIEVTLGYENGVQHVYLNGRDVSVQIRAEEVGKLASAAAAKAQVRSKLTELQRGMAATQNVIMDGRDIGTVILPEAQMKIFLTASVETRAQRRYKELTAKNVACDIEVIRKDIEARDYQDSHREVAPLKQAEDAVLVDSSDMTAEEVTELLIRMAKDKM